MNILICNVGSTSLKYQLFRMPEELVLASGGVERVGAGDGRFYAKTHKNGTLVEESAAFPTQREAIARMLSQLTDTVLPDLAALDCVGFKVVLAKGVSGVQYLTDDVLAKMEAFSSIAPAHNPPYAGRHPAVPHVAARLRRSSARSRQRSTALMPPEAYCYSIPIEVSRKYDIRRNGFHGASIEYLTKWTQERMEREDLRLVVCHLGGSGSICAVKNGKSVDTSLGLTLQCGTMHNNRCGDIDPYIIFYLVESCGMTLEEVKQMLQTKSGLYGMSGGVGRDLRDVQAAAEAGNEDAELAIRAYCYSIKKYIGAYAAVMGGLDAIVFGGGIGLNSPLVRALSLEGLEFLGVRLDGFKNRMAIAGMDISMEDAPVRVFTVHTDEEIIVARKAAALLAER